LPFPQLLPRITGDSSVRRAFFVFTLTRILVLAIVLIGGQINRVFTGDEQSSRDAFVSLEKLPVSHLLNKILSAADMNWYAGIAHNGYEKIPFTAGSPHNWAFFPVFPLLWRAAAQLTGEYPISGIVLSHLCFFLGLIYVHKTWLAFGYSKPVADRGLFYLAVFPTAYFFSLPMTESLFLFLTASCFFCAKRGRWWTAGILGALASGTRVTGIFLLPALAVIYWQAYGGDWRRKETWRGAVWRKEVVGLLLVPAGLGSFMIYLHRITGNPLAFKDILVAWNRSAGFFLVTLYSYLSDPWLIIAPWDFRLVNFAAPVLALGCGAWLMKQRQWALGLYTLICVMAALSSLVLQSQARYAMVLFPMYLVLAQAGERPHVDETIRAGSIALLCLMTGLLSAHFSMALS
jgi:hypothetical protein